MPEILKKITDLNEVDQHVFLGMIYTDEELKNHFHNFLKSTDSQSRDNFLALFRGNFKAKLENWIDNASLLSEGDLIKTTEIIAETHMNIETKKKELENNLQKAKEDVQSYREVMKGNIQRLDNHVTDQIQGVPAPPITIEDNAFIERIPLPRPEKSVLKNTNIFECIENRQSRRKFTEEPLSLEELSYLLWATQGVKKEFSHKKFSMRTVPSGGARHPFETYLAVNHVEGLKPGIYRYMPFDHQLSFLFTDENMKEKMKLGALEQQFAGDCAVSFIWTVIPYRTEWRYSTESKKIILQDSGHLCQNLYLACESIQCGTCAIGAYNQESMDALIRVDGKEEFVVYLAPVGKYETN